MHDVGPYENWVAGSKPTQCTNVCKRFQARSQVKAVKMRLQFRHVCLPTSNNYRTDERIAIETGIGDCY
jgi:hypothetical protein